jgi:uncharacterized protein (TIGR02001 family)
LTAGIGLAALAAPASVQAQVSARLSLDSDYVLRGVSMTDGQPTMSAALFYDHPSGAYGGVDLTAAATHSGVEALGHVADLGYAWRGKSGVAWDIGVQESRIGAEDSDNRSLHYVEVYAGLTKSDVSVHVYYSPDFGSERKVLYVDVSAAAQPRAGWRVFGHVGASGPLGGDRSDSEGLVWDANAGVARDYRNAELRLTWSATTSSSYLPDMRTQERGRIQGGVSVFF